MTYGVEPVTAIIMLAGIFYGAQYGGTITSVLLRLPGEASSVVTVFDGYQSWLNKGKAGTALGIAAIGSFIGGTSRHYRPDVPGSVGGQLRAGLRPAGVHGPGNAGHLAGGDHQQRHQNQGDDRRSSRPAAGHVGRDIFTGAERFTFGNL